MRGGGDGDGWVGGFDKWFGKVSGGGRGGCRGVEEEEDRAGGYPVPSHIVLKSSMPIPIVGKPCDSDPEFVVLAIVQQAQPRRDVDFVLP